MEFILHPFLNYDFIFISLAFSRGGVREKRKRKKRGREIWYRFKGFLLLFVSQLLSVSKVEGFSGSCRDANFIPMKPEPRRHITNTMKTYIEVRQSLFD